MKNSLQRKTAYFICSGFGVGYFTIFPGTLASFIILPLLWILKDTLSLNMIVILIFIYTVICYFLLKIILHKKKNMDPSYIVCDEYIGQSLALLFCNQNVFDYFMAFLIFRILDVLKPFPINYIDNLKTTSSVLLDDILAGLITACCFFIYNG